jgi:peroxiredoxin Q/BCP
MAIQVGDRAPSIRTPGFDLATLRGKPVVLFFFPKADTPGCTKETCEFRDASRPSPSATP